MSDLKRDAAGDSLLSTHARAMLESTDEGVLSLDLQGRVTFINAAGSRMLGYEPEEILGANLHALIHHTRPDGSPYPEEVCPVYRAFRTGQGCRVADEVFWRKDGSSFPVEYSSHPIIEEGKVAGAVVTFIDITERRQTTEALQESEERFRLLVGGVKDYAIFMLDPEGRVVSWNEGARRIKGYRQEEILGRHFSVFYPEEDVERGKHELEVAKNEGAYEEEGWRVRQDGSRFWASVLITPCGTMPGGCVVTPT